MAPQKLKVNMLGVESGKELAGIPVGDESAEDRVLALLGGGAAEDAYQVSGLFNLFHIERYYILLFKTVHFLPQDAPRPEGEARKSKHSGFPYPFFTHRSQSVPRLYSSHRLPLFHFVPTFYFLTILQGWGSTFFHDSLDFVSATASPAGRTVFRLTVLPSHCNRLGNLHGGCTATIFDICTSTALAPIAKPGYWQYAGVSRGLSVTYLKPVPVGEKVLVDSEVVSAGKRMCVLRGTMRRESDGEVLALCEHGKVSIDPPVSKI